MATRTTAAAVSTVQPRLVHAGLNVATASYHANGNTTSASDVILMTKIPNKATIVDWYVRGHAGSSTTTFKLGFPGSDQALGLFTLGATDSRVNGVTALPYTVNLSDDAVQSVTLQATANTVASATVTASFAIVVNYVAQGNI